MLVVELMKSILNGNIVCVAAAAIVVTSVAGATIYPNDPFGFG